jgi:hypothetical protein
MSLTKVTYSMIESGMVNVLDFGADPTGVADSTSAINAAFAKANTLYVAYSALYNSNIGGKPIVYFPEGNYKITSAIGNGQNNVIVRGVNSVLFSTSTTINLLSLGTYNITVENMTFDGGQHHIKFGGTRIESGHMYVNNCIFNIASKCCVIVDRGDIPGFSGYPAIIRVDNSKSYGSPFLEAYTNGAYVTDCWLAWNVGTATQALIKGNDKIVCKGLLEVPFGTATASEWSRFSSPTPVAFGDEDVLSVNVRDSRFGGEAVKVPLVVFSSKGDSLVMDGCAVFGESTTHWGKFYAIPRRLSITNCIGNGFIDSWGMWFYQDAVDTLAEIPTNCEFNLQLNTQYITAYGRTVSYTPNVRGGVSLGVIPDQNLSSAKDAADVSLTNLIPGDGLTWYGAPYTTTSSNAALSGTNALLGYTLGTISASANNWYYGINITNFTAPVQGIMTFSCWVYSNCYADAQFVQENTGVTATTVVTQVQKIQPGLNFVTARFYGAGTAQTPQILFSGTGSTDVLTVGLMAIHAGAIAGRWQPPSYTNSALSRHYYGATTPATGAWQRGDIMWNTAPAAGGTPGWMCTTAGSPGTWKAMANLAV